MYTFTQKQAQANARSFNLKKPTLIVSFLMVFTILFAMFSFAHAAGQSWQYQETKVKGEWSIEQRDDGNYIVLNDDFKTKNAPDLKIFLSKKEAGNITDDNATQEAIQVAKLSSNKGAQSYKIPSDVNVVDYQSIIIHCEQYSKLWAADELK